ncbi:luciferin sulfotransferase-like [Phlebotomus papatasi]|uniref:luciferin sulfotransferase-like n=1 Tax=Phlebotomus papatasi TaxID=29031 RepID=UPI0024839202|nr:luciferin sulfotransferase-like [Phlebotomus papatasi]
MPAKYRTSAQVIENFQVRPDDVWVVTFPKCGTTWTQEMVWQICNDLDYEKGNSTELHERFPFFDLLRILAIYAPYDSHIIDFWNMRNEDNILFFTYEEMKKNLPNVIRRATEFLGKCYTDEQITSLADHLSLEKMSKNESINRVEELDDYYKKIKFNKDKDYNFIRKGKVGSFHQEMTPDVVKECDTWIRNRIAKYQDDPHLLEIFLANTCLNIF